MPSYQYTDVTVEIKGRIGIIKLNRPRFLNAFSEALIMDTINGLRELNEHPETVITVLTGEGRFFSAGADIRGTNFSMPTDVTPAQLKVAQMVRFTPMLELMRLVIDHRKVFVLALNGPGVGGGAAWFPGVADIVLATDKTFLQVPFNALGLVPEMGSSTNISRHMGILRTNDFLMFGKKLTAHQLEAYGLVNRIFPTEGFHDSVIEFLENQLEVNDGKSMMETRRLQNAPLRRERILAIYDATEALAERFVEGAPIKRFLKKAADLEAKSKSRL